MKPEDIVTSVEQIMNQSLPFPWWSYLLALIVPFFGGFLCAYLKKKGESLATKEDFDSLLEQLKETTTTTTTEGIKTELAKGSWLHQQE